MTLTTSKLGGMVQDEREKLASCVKLLLLWVAASDGNLDDAELEFVSSQFPDSDAAVTTDDLLAVIRNADLNSMEMAIRTVGEESRELRIAFMDMAISMSMADHRIAITENHILRFYADALYLGAGLLEKRFEAVTGAPFGEPGDPGDPSWWEAIAHAGEMPALEAMTGEGMTDKMARSVLGVDATASMAEIDQAYQNQSAIFQLDRVEALGKAAVAVADSRLGRIEEAYAILRS
jgi:uncharacterized tellurite resistance protein B-like protein